MRFVIIFFEKASRILISKGILFDLLSVVAAAGTYSL